MTYLASNWIAIHPKRHKCCNRDRLRSTISKFLSIIFWSTLITDTLNGPSLLMFVKLDTVLFHSIWDIPSNAHFDEISIKNQKHIKEYSFAHFTTIDNLLDITTGWKISANFIQLINQLIAFPCNRDAVSPIQISSLRYFNLSNVNRFIIPIWYRPRQILY